MRAGWVRLGLLVMLAVLWVGCGNDPLPGFARPPTDGGAMPRDASTADAGGDDDAGSDDGRDGGAGRDAGAREARR